MIYIQQRIGALCDVFHALTDLTIGMRIKIIIKSILEFDSDDESISGSDSEIEIGDATNI